MGKKKIVTKAQEGRLKNDGGKLENTEPSLSKLTETYTTSRHYDIMQ